jgi:lambda repressor-like predicted transcriptional regulator
MEHFVPKNFGKTPAHVTNALMQAENSYLRVLLQRELTERCAKNPRYSLRSFSKQVGVPISSLSSIMNGKRTISNKMKMHLAGALGWSLNEIENTRVTEEQKYHTIGLDSFHIISEWYHFAILELLKVKGYKQDPKWIAKALGITPSEVNIAFERLLRVGILEQRNGKYVDITGGSTTWNQSYFTTDAKKRLQKALLEKAVESLYAVPIEERDNTSMTMAINTKDIDKAKKLITEFRRKFSNILERDKSKVDSVYQLAIAFYPLTSREEI